MTHNPGHLADSFFARCVLALLSGAVYSMAYPPIGWRWLVVPGIAGLMVALRGQHGTRARTIGFIHGMAAFALGLSWLYQIFGAFVVALWCVLAGFTALFAEMQSRAGLRGIKGWHFVIFTSVNWCAWEFIRAELFPLKFPWMTAGLAAGPNALLPWIGVYGVSVFVVLCSILIVTRNWKSAAAVIALLALMTGLNPIETPPPHEDPLTVKVGGLQLENVSLDAFLSGTNQLPPDTQYVVWPEYAVPYDIRSNKRDWNLIQDLCRDRGITLTFGTQSRSGNDKWRNIALTLDANGVLGEHTKVHTVHFFDDGSPGITALPVPTSHGKTGTPICFDCDYEGVVRKMTMAGAEMFVVPMMDAESWTARQHDQHAELFRIRACESDRWMFVCATSGVSQVIDSNGHVHERLQACRPGTILGSMKRKTNLTFHTRIGWLTPWGVLILAAGCWIYLLLPWKKEAIPNKLTDSSV